MKTTLNQIREFSPCHSGWEKLLRSLGKTHADDEPLSILQIIDSNGIEHAQWCLRAVEGFDKEIRLYAVWCARQVQHLMKDQRSLDALDVAERFAHGKATLQELNDAWNAARAARAAASDGAWAATWAAAWAAASATWDPAWAAWAASDAVWAVTWAAASDASNVARAASDAAMAAARATQEKELRGICLLIENHGKNNGN